MREFQDRQRLQKKMFSKTALVVLFVILIAVGQGTYKVYQKKNDSQQSLDRVLKQKQELEARTEKLKIDDARLRTPEGVEAEIRSKFDVSKQDEGVVVIVEKASTTAPVENGGFVQRVWNSVKGVFGGSQKDTATTSQR